MDNIGERELFRKARHALKGEDDAVFMYGATKPDGEAMKKLTPDEAEEVRRLQDKILEDTEKHSKLLEEMIKQAEGTEGSRPLSPDRMKFLPQFEGLFKTESKMLVEHLELFQKYLKIRGYDKWARGLQNILRDEFRHVEMTHRLLSLAALFNPEE